MNKSNTQENITEKAAPIYNRESRLEKLIGNIDLLDLACVAMGAYAGYSRAKGIVIPDNAEILSVWAPIILNGGKGYAQSSQSAYTDMAKELFKAGISGSVKGAIEMGIGYGLGYAAGALSGK